VIALGRVMLAALFMLAVWVDRSQPSQAPGPTYGFLALYLIFAAVVAAMTWRNWWLDARLAAPAHAIDMAVFTAIVFSTNGYTSPFFVFFALPLLAAAIRWSWRETALTAAALVLLYLLAGMMVAGSEPFEAQRFTVRAGHLMILSALIIWFGIHQSITRLFFQAAELDSVLGSGAAPVDAALRFAMGVTGAQSGLLALRSSDEEPFAGRRLARGEESRVILDHPMLTDESLGTALLYDFRIDGALGRALNGRSLFLRASRLFNAEEAGDLGLTEGLVAKISTGRSEGWLVLEDIPELSSDYVVLGRELGQAVGAIIDRAALVSAFAESAAARTRLTLARDVHDSIVQFLAGATFRVEAIARAARSGADVDKDLKDLKGLLVEEQADIRGFVTALRRDRELQLEESVDELRALAARLGQQWSVKCTVKTNGKQAPIPIRLQLDLEQLLREAVANAVRHGGASKVDVSLAVDGDQLHFDVRDNGSGFGSANGGSPIEPWSLRERVDRANGSLLLVSKRGRTDISISLPLSGASA
jgi:signal transduction histidine kinase